MEFKFWESRYIYKWLYYKVENYEIVRRFEGVSWRFRGEIFFSWVVCGDDVEEMFFKFGFEE